MEQERIIGEFNKVPETLADVFAHRRNLSNDLANLKREIKEPQDALRRRILIFLPSGVLKAAKKKVEMTEVRDSHYEVKVLSTDVLTIIQAANDEVLATLEGQLQESAYKASEVHVAHLGENVAGAYNLINEKTFVDPQILEAVNENYLQLSDVLNHEGMHKQHEKASKQFGVAFKDPDHEIIEGLNSLIDNYVNKTPIPSAYQRFVDMVKDRMKTARLSLHILANLYLKGNKPMIAAFLGYELQTV